MNIQSKFICHSCRLQRSARPTREVFLQQHKSYSIQSIQREDAAFQRGFHSNSSRISPTRKHSTTPTPRPAISINAPSPIPISTQGLHTALLDLERDAINYVPLSRLKLALRSIEKAPEDTVIRIALLGLGDVEAARRLARCLLADVLGGKAAWEDALEDGTDKRAILLR